MSQAALSRTTASATTGPSSTIAAPGHKARIALRTLQVVLALFFIVASGLPKLLAASAAVESFDKIGFGDWFMYFVGSLEVAGGIALLIPILSGVAATAFIGLMIGAFITTVTALGGHYAVTPLILIIPFALIAWARRHHNAELFRLIRRCV
ncbi:DoxX family protein [Streptomyces sp. NPDC006733]|uniref:DoxX family protein n=1 Tax=Streptomyces sp. NPDC006733 TaxID=3155460 RepID=UPI00340EFF24